MPEPQTAQEPWREKQGILEVLKAAIDQILVLHRLEIDAVVKGDLEALERVGRDLQKIEALMLIV